ncbi:hypothetical protein C173_29846 [Paenibacillus sp. FSL R7-277]|uniref:Beta-lactam-binding protein with PASTA domain n=1 Tax=Paenibacillus silagei TaxID=1670801 RepID=A0ABS4NP98_9BACL|nr:MULTISPECIES: PASTA domain-containing protein [Paenibacillus]ETT58958.1 hypothetical protein C173_29846 [Paenibacillus sp. FSL R7-277]MBP2111888.1 beta-lactam-binding protein with PASTA domain [Paenibacillus silagei]OMF88356.1 hypothetical protein BK146_24780 [Paenibacillus sp. FSL R7-0333]
MIKKWLLSSFEINLRFRRVYLLTTIGVIVIAISIVFAYRENPKKSNVPFLVGLSEQEAVTLLENLNLRVNIKEDANNYLVENGIVTGQSPIENTQIAKNEIVTISVKNNK